jgi:hypothetical protein
MISPDNESGSGKVNHRFIPSKKTMPPKKVLLRVTKSNSFEGMESLIFLPGAMYRPHIIIDLEGVIWQYSYLDYEGLNETADGVVLIDLIHPGIFEAFNENSFRTRNGLIHHDPETHGELIDHPTNEKLAYTLINDAQTETLMHLRAAFNKHLGNKPFPFEAYPDDESELCIGLDRNPYLRTARTGVGA